jgi:hypothetical protein
MTTVQYICGNARRRQVLADPASPLNGIDYLEVIDRAYLAVFVEGDPRLANRQRTLLVRFFKQPADAIASDQIVIEGGVRVSPARVDWVLAADDAELNVLVPDAAERQIILDHAQPEPEKVLIVRTESAGDFSTYRLRLVASEESSAPPEGFDEILSVVEFSFKVECPSDFDCRAERVCPVEPAVEPVIDYLAKDYESFRRLMLDRLAIIMPNWRERNPADLGIALVELLAYAGDRLSYYQDAAATEAHLGTARRRSSIRRHARLLDYRMHDGCNARVWVAFELASADEDPVRLHGGDSSNGEKATRLLTRIPTDPVIDLSDESTRRLVAAHQPETFELMHDTQLYHAHNMMHFHIWGDEECCLPRAATTATLIDGTLIDDVWQHDDANRLRLRVGDVLIFEERISPVTGIDADADPARRHAVRLTAVSPEAELNGDGVRQPSNVVKDELLDTPIVHIEWATEDALPFAFCLSTLRDGEHVERMSVARGNVALVDHGDLADVETLPKAPEPTPDGRLRYRPILQEQGITLRVADDEAAAMRGAASAALVRDPQDALPAISLEDDVQTWRPRRDLLDSDRFDAHFVVELENDGTSQLRFARADDEQGLIPTPDRELKARYRVGSGLAGNVGAEAIAHVVEQEGEDLSEIAVVRNPLPARGGVEPESLERVRLDAPQAFRVPQRAVTEADYATMAQRHPDVQRAIARRRWTGSWHTIFITVDRYGGRPVDAAFEDELRAFLKCYRLAGHDVEIEPPIFVPLDIAMTVCVEHGYFAADVEIALLEVFSDRDLPDGRRGFFHPGKFTFGQPVYLSRMVAAAMAVPGVRWVDLTDDGTTPNRFRRFAEDSHGESEAGLIAMARLEIAQLENDPNAPEHGRIEFLMEDGS